MKCHNVHTENPGYFDTLGVWQKCRITCLVILCGGGWPVCKYKGSQYAKYKGPLCIALLLSSKGVFFSKSLYEVKMHNDNNVEIFQIAQQQQQLQQKRRQEQEQQRIAAAAANAAAAASAAAPFSTPATTTTSFISAETQVRSAKAQLQWKPFVG